FSRDWSSDVCSSDLIKVSDIRALNIAGWIPVGSLVKLRCRASIHAQLLYNTCNQRCARSERPEHNAAFFIHLFEALSLYFEFSLNVFYQVFPVLFTVNTAGCHNHYIALPGHIYQRDYTLHWVLEGA